MAASGMPATARLRRIRAAAFVRQPSEMSRDAIVLRLQDRWHVPGAPQGIARRPQSIPCADALEFLTNIEIL